MKKLISTQLLGALALVCSTAGMAATVEVRPGGTCSAPGVACATTVTAGDTFTLTVHGDGFPQTAGATLGLTWNTAVVNVTNVVAAPGTPFTGGVIAAAPWNPITIIGPLVGQQPSGSFDTFLITVQALAAGNANIQLIDDQADLCWTDANSGFCVPVTYSQANVNVLPAVVPVPAAAWLLMSALGGLVGMKRLRRQA